MATIVSSSYTQYEQVWASSEGMRSPKMYTFVPAYVSANADAIKISHPGLFAGDLGNGKARLLPRTRLTTASATNSTSLVLAANTIGAFVADDVVYALPPYAVITFALTWANDDVAEISLNGVVVSYTVAGYSTLAALATTYAAYLNADQRFAQIGEAYASGATVWIMAKDCKSLYAIASNPTTAGDGTLAITGSATALAYNNTAVGTVSSLAHSTNTITLSGNAGVAVPVGVPVGVRSVKPLGLIGKPHDFTATVYHPGDGSDDLGVYTSGSVYRARLPYIDGEIEAMYPELTLV